MKSLVNASGFLVKTPNLVCPMLVFSTRMPPIRAVSSGAVRVSSGLYPTVDLSWCVGVSVRVGAEAVRRPFEYRKRLHVSLLL